MTKASTFRVALTADFYDAAGNLKYRDIGLSLLNATPKIEFSRFTHHEPEIGPTQLANLQGAIVLAARVTARSLADNPNLLAIGRFGVGYDNVDVAACTAADVVLFITAGAVDHSVAEASVGWMLALARHMRIKDLLVRTGKWNERSNYMGCELRGKTLGVIGFGGIGRAVVKMLSGFGMNTPLIFDPFVPPSVIADAGVNSVPLDELLAASDFVSVHCPLNQHTVDLLSLRELSLMKPTAYLLNTARGGIVNEDALFQVLQERRIAGAAIDCFVGEPLTTTPRWAELDNVLLAPHAIAWTDELFRDIGRAACQGMIDLSHGQRPRGVVNPEVFERHSFQSKWERLIV